MRIILTVSLLFVIALFTVSCVQKQPFVKEKVADESALVYLYRPLVHGSNDVGYRLYVDNEKISYILRGGEYAPVHLKAGRATFRAIANGILEHRVTLNLENGTEYFIRMLPQEGGDFTMKVLPKSIAILELSNTFLSGSELSIDTDNTKLIPPKPSQASGSVSDEISKLYNLKEQGIISEEEFRQLKAKIISR